MIRKAERVLRVICLIAIVFASLGLGLSGFTNYFQNLSDAQTRSAVEECLEFQSPHAVIANGTIYCYLTIQGNEMVAPIETLRYKPEAK